MGEDIKKVKKNCKATEPPETAKRGSYVSEEQYNKKSEFTYAEAGLNYWGVGFKNEFLW